MIRRITFRYPFSSSTPITAPIAQPAQPDHGMAVSWRVLVVDDHPPIQAWVRETLAPHGIAVEGVRSGEEALQLVESGERFNAAICDILMPHAKIEGIAAARALWHEHRIPCLILTSVQEAGARLSSLYAGAMGYVLKDMAESSVLVANVRAVLEGRPVVDPLAQMRLSEQEVQQIAEARAAYRRATEQLTPQQRVIAALIMEGKTNQEIADELRLSRSTVNSHVSNILQRLGLSTRREVKSRVLLAYPGETGAPAIDYTD